MSAARVLSRMGGVVATSAVLALSTGTLTACGSELPAIVKPGTVWVVAAENFWGDVAAQVGGSHVTVTSIITSPTIDPHTFASNPQDAAEISSADLVIENGLGYDDFVDKILATGGRSGRHVLSVQHVLGITGSSPNPHVWYWTARLPAVASAIARELSAIDPEHRASYHANAQRFDRSLRPLLDTIATIRQKYAGTPIAYTERVPGYLVQATGLRLATPLSFSAAIEDGNDPGPEDTAVFDADLRQHKVKVLLYNSQVIDARTTHIKRLAMSSGVPVVGMAETMPPGETFQHWQLEQDRALLQALGG